LYEKPPSGGFSFLVVVISLYLNENGEIMIFAILLLDRPGVAELRTKVRPEHRDYLAKLADKMAFSGPLTSEDGKTAVGSLLVMDFPSKADAQAWLSEEPFTKAGVYEKPIIHAFTNMWQQKVGFPAST
jgi:uncharacterized protein YciI